MIARFADSSYFLALLIPNDQYHAKAMHFAGWKGRLITTEFVLLEVGNSLASPPSRQIYSQFMASIAGDRCVTTLPASHELLRQGLNLYQSRADKGWSLTDCTSFVIMNEHGITEALTSDHHFEQAGFAVLLK